MKLFGLSLEGRRVIWKVVVDFDNYEVSNEGKIRSRLRKKERKLRSDKDGYQEVVLFKDGVRYYAKVHQIVAKAFLKPIEGKTEVNHKDRNRQNNAVSNLEYMNRQENMAHRYAITTSGEDYGD